MDESTLRELRHKSYTNVVTDVGCWNREKLPKRPVNFRQPSLSVPHAYATKNNSSQFELFQNKISIVFKLLQWFDSLNSTRGRDEEEACMAIRTKLKLVITLFSKWPYCPATHDIVTSIYCSVVPEKKDLHHRGNHLWSTWTVISGNAVKATSYYEKRACDRSQAITVPRNYYGWLDYHRA